MKRDYNTAQLGGPPGPGPQMGGGGGMGGPGGMIRARMGDFNSGGWHPHHQLHPHPHHHHPHHHLPQQPHFYHHNNNNAMMMTPSKAGMAPGKQLMSFQNYVRTLSNSVDENTAYRKYKDFMANLSQSKVGRFFDANKDREWFKLKYHPVEGQQTMYLLNANFQKRLKIFFHLVDKKFFDKLSYTSSNHEAILNLMDAIIVHLEDGPQDLIDQLLSLDNSKLDNNLRQKYVPSKPTSVVINDLNIDSTLAEIQEVCTAAHPDLMRIAQLDPYYIEGGHLRRKIIAIYKDTADIRDVCWKLSRMKLNNRSLNVLINRCLTNRILSVDAIANHHISVVNDIRNAITLILNFDEHRGLYGKRKQIQENALKEEPMDTGKVTVKSEPMSQENGDVDNDVAPLSPPGSDKSVKDEDGEKPFDVSTLDEDKEKEKKKFFEFKFNTNLSLHRQVSKLNKSKNPILAEAHIYLVEFVDSTEALYQLAKVPADLQQNPVDVDLDEIDADRYLTIKSIVENLPCTLEESTRFLDKMLWYLRIVHSFDFYKKAYHRQEDELTLRLGVIHLRDNSSVLSDDIDESAIRNYLQKSQHELEEFGQSLAQKYVTKDEERFNYKSYGKVIADELTSYAQRIQKPKSTETEEVYKCKHCTRVFAKLSDIGRHFVGKHRWAVDTIELETDFFNAYLFDPTKINPSPPKELLELPPNRFARLTNFSQMGEDPDLLQQTIEAYSKMESFVREPAPRVQVESDPRNETIVDYTDISFDEAI